MNESLVSPGEWQALLHSPDAWRQAGVFLLGAGAMWLLGSFLRGRLAPIVEPGGVTGVGRTAVRTTAIALIPALFWLWLAIAAAIFRKLGYPTDILRPAMYLIGAAALIRASVFVLRHSFSPGSRLKAWEGTLAATIWLVVALHILGWLPLVEQVLDEYALVFGSLRISLYNVVTFALLIGLLLLAALWLSTAIRWRVVRSEVLDDSMKHAVTKLATFVLLIVAVLTAMVAAGIDLTAFAVFGGALGVGLGLGLQRVVSNFVSGFILAFEGSIREGDIISIGSQRGRVVAMHARHIVVHADDGVDVLVPNENLLTSNITNWSYEGDRTVRFSVPLQVSYDNDPEAVMALMVRLAREHPRVLARPEPSAVIVGFGDSGLNLELRGWIEDVERGVGDVRSDICRRVWQEFKAAGISISYPRVRLVGLANGQTSEAKDASD
jgi:small-conductance mechanosensitive channel